MALRRCPFCGKQYDDYHVPQKVLNDLISQKSERVRGLIREIIDKRSRIEALTSTDVHSFLSKIISAENRAIELGIDLYSSRYLEDPEKGLSYLSALILKDDRNIDKRRKVERQMYGIPPKKVTVDEST